MVTAPWRHEFKAGDAVKMEVEAQDTGDRWCLDFKHRSMAVDANPNPRNPRCFDKIEGRRNSVTVLRTLRIRYEHCLEHSES